MTAVQFHHNAADPTLATCQLIAEQVAAGRRVLAFAPDPARASLLDQALWSFSPLSFVPHCLAGAGNATITPVVIGAAASDAREVLVNFSDELPPDVAQFETVIEVVSTHPAERDSARARFKRYREQGVAPSAHDLNEARAHG